MIAILALLFAQFPAPPKEDRIRFFESAPIPKGFVLPAAPVANFRLDTNPLSIWEYISSPNFLGSQRDLLTGEQSPYLLTTSVYNTSVWQTVPEVKYLIFAAGPSKTIRLDLTTGKVLYEGFTPDAAALAFWASVTSSFPYVRTLIEESDRRPWNQR